MKKKRSIDWHTKVLRCLENSDIPMSAYDVLGELRRFNPKIAPPTVYRALNALAEQGRVHRVESMNAYVACQRRGHSQAPMLSVCDLCGAVDEYLAPGVHKAIHDAMVDGTSSTGFVATRQVIEVHGHCGSCADRSQSVERA